MVFKCKMCGGDIQATQREAFGSCDSCGTTQPLPKASDERKANLFNRANHFRRQNDFDKALQAYENILNEDNTDAEAHWGVVLSRHGIEYVEDPVSHQRIPTCRRVQNEPILSDADYVAALEYAPDSYTKSLYEEEAKKIGEIQKGILAISSKEEPYDVFICYKETTDGGSRTKDSTFAQDIYYQLANDGYRVFFARITLEDKLGHQYEPYIFSALNSAKVMLVIGTQKEYFEATWVKNEWSRFLAIMKKDRSKLLIPCYRDMDAYDIPDELASLQSQDMSKVGFIQDILRGVKKVLDASKEAKKLSAPTVVGAPVAPGVESLMKRGWLFLEDSDWKQADEYFDKVLDIDPEYAPAYIGKLCAELKKQKEEFLENNEEPISEQNNFKKALRFSDAEIQKKLEGYDQKIRLRILQNEYAKLVQLKNKARTEDEYLSLASKFKAMGNYEDSPKLAIECDNEYHLAKQRREEQERIKRIEQERLEKQEQQARIERERLEQQKKQQKRQKEQEIYESELLKWRSLRVLSLIIGAISFILMAISLSEKVEEITGGGFSVGEDFYAFLLVVFAILFLLFFVSYRMGGIALFVAIPLFISLFFMGFFYFSGKVFSNESGTLNAKYFIGLFLMPIAYIISGATQEKKPDKPNHMK